MSYETVGGGEDPIVAAANSCFGEVPIERCPICDVRTRALDVHLDAAHPPYREPWWLRLLRWLAR